MDLTRPPGIRRSAESIANLPEYILSTFFPMASPLVKQYPRALRLLSVLFAIYYLSPVARLTAIWDRISSFIVSNVSVSSEEDLFEYLIAWLSEHRTLRADQSLVATCNVPQERRRHRRDPDYEESTRKPQTDAKIRYEQSQGLQIFIYKKRFFFVKRMNGEGHTYHEGRYRRIENLSIYCLGRSTQPIKDLLDEIYWEHKDKEKTLTIIRRPYTGGYSSKLAWSRITAKPRRALDTVILDANHKEDVVADIEEYMDPSTQNFYAQHGIPYRRGYLFHGPPGTGKTSFALAVASKFSLDVYVLTLLDRELSDSDLISLLTQLPTRSLLLLEDIDTAGLSRKNKSLRAAAAARRQLGLAESSPTDLLDDVEDDELLGESEERSRVSLSGLLNAIDGVASPEGHILIMTTNKPDELDEALVRAGRISVRVEFKNASRKQAQELFERMYMDSPTSTTSKLGVQDVKDAAGRFAHRIPDHDFSPADLQDYLLIHKRDLEGAVAGVEGWKGEILEDRKRKEEEKAQERELRGQLRRERVERRARERRRRSTSLDGEMEKTEKEEKAKEAARNGAVEKVEAEVLKDVGAGGAETGETDSGAMAVDEKVDEKVEGAGEGREAEDGMGEGVVEETTWTDGRASSQLIE